MLVKLAAIFFSMSSIFYVKLPLKISNGQQVHVLPKVFAVYALDK